MKHKLFSVYDEKANAFLPPFSLHREQMAMRAFADCVNDPNHAFGRHPADYTLFELGEFDDATGRLAPNASNRNLGNGVVFLNKEVQGEFALEPVDTDTPPLSIAKT